MSKEVTLSFRVDRPTEKKLREIAKIKSTLPSSIIREAITLWFQQNPEARCESHN